MELSAKKGDITENKLSAQATISAADVDRAIKRTYRDISQKYSFQGFRKGHTPRPVIDSMYGREAVAAAATNTLLYEAEPLILSEIDVVAIADIDYGDLSPVTEHQDFTVEMKIPVEPEIELSSYEPVSIEMPPQEVTDAELENQIEMLLTYQAQPDPAPKGTGVQEDQFVEVTFEALTGAQDLDGQKRVIRPDQASYPQELRDGLLGMKVDETKEITYTDDEGNKNVVNAHVESIYNYKTPELTDELAKEKLGFNTAAELKEAVKKEIAHDKEHSLPELKHQRVVAALLERANIEKLDETYQRHVLQGISRNFMNNLQAQGQTVDSFLAARGIQASELMADLQVQAERFAREALAVDALVRNRSITATEDDVFDEFEKAGFATKDIPDATVAAARDGRLPEIREGIRRAKAVEWLIETAQVSEVDEVARARADHKAAKSASSKKKEATKTAAKKAESAKKTGVKKTSAAAKKSGTTKKKSSAQASKKAPAKKSATQKKATTKEKK